MNILLIAAFVIAAAGLCLLLKPELLWRPLQKEKDAVLSSPFAAFLRLGGFGLMALSVLLAQLVQ